MRNRRDFVILASYGNDSLALIEIMRQRGFASNSIILFNDTGWANSDWMVRVLLAEAWANMIGFETSRTESMGLEELVRKRKGWPRQGMQFCTLELKIKPTMEWLKSYDPDGKCVCVVGVRREESVSRRHFPEFQPFSANHGNRHVWAPICDVKENRRNELIEKTGFDILPHRSMECSPCINSNRQDLLKLKDFPEDIDKVERIENNLGYSSKGKPRVMFRPASKMGATGIREVMRWAESARGKYQPLDEEEGESGCDTGWCGI